MIHSLSLVALVLSSGAVSSHDTEWPPQADPTPGSSAAMSSIDIAMPQPLPSYFGHQHSAGGWCEWPLWFTFASQLHGPDDDDQYLIINFPYELVIIARIDLDWPAKTGTLTPLYVWNDLPATGHAAGSACNSNSGPHRR